MYPTSSNRAETLMELAQAAFAAGETAEEWLLELAASEIVGSSSKKTDIINNYLRTGKKIKNRGADYLRSITRRIAQGSYAAVEVELAELFKALTTWRRLTVEQMMTVLIRLTNLFGEPFKEFLFRASRAAMVVFNLTVPQLGAILLRIGSFVLTVTSVLVVLVLLAILASITLPLGAALLPLVVICSVASAVITIVQNLAVILSVLPFPGASGASSQMGEWYADNTWFGAMCTVLQTICSAPSMVMTALVTVALTSGLTLARIAETLKRSGLTAVAVMTLLITGWEAARSRCSQDVKALAQALNLHLGQTAEQVGNALSSARISLDDIWDGITTTFNPTRNRMANILKSIGAEANTIAEKLKNKTNATAEDVAKALKDAGFSANDVARAIKDKFGQDVLGVVRVLKNAGWAMSEIVEVVSNVFGVARSVVETAARAAGLM